MALIAVAMKSDGTAKTAYNQKPLLSEPSKANATMLAKNSAFEIGRLPR